MRKSGLGIPLTPAALPAQATVIPTSFPRLPEGISASVSYDLPETLKHLPRNPAFLCQLEWSWSPAHGRIDNYYLHSGRSDWTLYQSYFDDNDDPWRWSRLKPVAFAAKKPLDEINAAMFLMRELFLYEKKTFELGRFHMINSEGLLSVPQIRAVEYAVWDS